MYKNGQTLLHILCSEGKSDLLEKVANSFHIDLFTKNDVGQSLVDVLPKHNEEVAKTLLKITMAQMKEISDGKLLELKNPCTCLQTPWNPSLKPSFKLIPVVMSTYT